MTLISIETLKHPYITKKHQQHEHIFTQIHFLKEIKTHVFKNIKFEISVLCEIVLLSLYFMLRVTQPN